MQVKVKTRDRIGEVIDSTQTNYLVKLDKTLHWFPLNTDNLSGWTPSRFVMKEPVYETEIWCKCPEGIHIVKVWTHPTFDKKFCFSVAYGLGVMRLEDPAHTDSCLGGCFDSVQAAVEQARLVIRDEASFN